MKSPPSPSSLILLLSTKHEHFHFNQIVDFEVNKNIIKYLTNEK